MATPTTIRSYSDLLALLEGEGVMHQADAAENAVLIPTAQRGVEGVQLIRWQERDGVIQFIQSMPLATPAERVAAVSEALLRLNHALAIPGLDFDHALGIVSFRTYLPIFSGGDESGVEPFKIQAMFRISSKTAVDVVPVLRRVIAGDLAAADVVAEVQRELAAAAAAATAG